MESFGVMRQSNIGTVGSIQGSPLRGRLVGLMVCFPVIRAKYVQKEFVQPVIAPIVNFIRLVPQGDAFGFRFCILFVQRFLASASLTGRCLPLQVLQPLSQPGPFGFPPTVAFLRREAALLEGSMRLILFVCTEAERIFPFCRSITLLFRQNFLVLIVLIGK